VPDRATFFVSVDGTAEVAKDAVARAETKVAAVRDALSRTNSGAEIGPAVSYSVGPSQSMRYFPQAAVGPSFTARVAIRVQVTRLATLATTIATALDAGAAQSTPPVFESSQADSVRRAAIADAMPAARREAEAVAASLGGRLGALVDVSTSGADRVLQGKQSVFAFDMGYAGMGVAPDVVVNLTTTARFRIVR
jgi:uncharacterized protein